MFLRRKVKALDEDITQSFKNVKRDIDNIIDAVNQSHRRADDAHQLATSIGEEIATNGVVRDIRTIQREFKALQEDYYRFRQELDSNGVATAINKLNAEVFKSRKEKRIKTSDMFSRLHLYMMGESVPAEEEATLAGKVDAIIAHLGLDVTVKPEEKTEAKVVAKKVTTKKKGRR